MDVNAVIDLGLDAVLGEEENAIMGVSGPIDKVEYRQSIMYQRGDHWKGGD